MQGAKGMCLRKNVEKVDLFCGALKCNLIKMRK